MGSGRTPILRFSLNKERMISKGGLEGLLYCGFSYKERIYISTLMITLVVRLVGRHEYEERCGVWKVPYTFEMWSGRAPILLKDEMKGTLYCEFLFFEDSGG